MRATRPFLFLLTAIMLFSMSAAPQVYAGKSKTPPPPPPNVTFPYSFKCPHCGMMITIKSAADWTKDCQTCACGTNNLGCYNQSDAIKKQ